MAAVAYHKLHFSPFNICIMPKVTKGEVIKLKEKKTVYATDAHPYAKAGEELRLHPKQVEHQKKKGFVTETPNGAKTKKEKANPEA